MTKIELNSLRRALKNKLAELDENRSAGRWSLAIETSADELDRIQFRQERELAMDDLNRNCELLREVRAALNRINAGTFGICLGCEEKIGLKRLSAVPWAASCIACQEAADKRTGQSRSGAPEFAVHG